MAKAWKHFLHCHWFILSCVLIFKMFSKMLAEWLWEVTWMSSMFQVMLDFPFVLWKLCFLYYSQPLSGLWSFPTANHLQNWLICFLPIIPETIAHRKSPEGTFSQLALGFFWRHFSAFPYYRLWHQTIEIRIRVWTSRKDICS